MAAVFYSPTNDRHCAALAEGFARPGARHASEDFEVACMVHVVVDDDVEQAAARVRRSSPFTSAAWERVV